jgi:hypothetical protein
MLSLLQCQLNVEITSNPKRFYLNKPPLEIIKLLSPTFQRILKVLLDAYAKSPRIRLSREIIAERAKCGITTVSRATTYFAKLGFLYIWQPSNESNIYKFEKSITCASVLEQLKVYFTIFMFFNLSLLASKTVEQNYVTPFTLKDNILNVRTAAALSNCTSPQYEYSKAEVYKQYEYDQKGEPNTKMSPEEAQLIFGTKKGTSTMEFTQEQIDQLQPYPKKSIEYATKMVTKDLHSGKSIGNPFGYLLAICKNHAAKEQTPQTGKTKSSGSVQNAPTQEYEHDEQATRVKLYDRKQAIIAKAMHLDLYDPKFTLFELQLMIKGYKVIGQVVDGEEIKPCPSNYMAPKAAPLSPTEVKMRAWNNEIIKVAVPEDGKISPKNVVNGKPPTFDEPLGQSNIGDYEDSFDDCY